MIEWQDPGLCLLELGMGMGGRPWKTWELFQGMGKLYHDCSISMNAFSFISFIFIFEIVCKWYLNRLIIKNWNVNWEVKCRYLLFQLTTMHLFIKRVIYTSSFKNKLLYLFFPLIFFISCIILLVPLLRKLEYLNGVNWNILHLF